MCGFNCFTNPQQASDWLQSSAKSNLLAYPTESVWGIGCDAMNEQAVRQILAIKNRPIDKGMIVVTDSVERVEPLLSSLTVQQCKTIRNSWKISDTTSINNSSCITSHVHRQAITWLLPIPEGIKIPNWITGKHNSLAVRVIAHPLIQKICANMVSEANPFGFIISTSCNPATLEPARTIKEAQNYFANLDGSDTCNHFDTVGYLQGATLGYDLPSQIRDGLSGLIIR